MDVFAEFVAMIQWCLDVIRGPRWRQEALSLSDEIADLEADINYLRDANRRIKIENIRLEARLSDIRRMAGGMAVRYVSKKESDERVRKSAESLLREIEERKFDDDPDGD